ncbi:MAG: glycosyltransferase family 39 protein [Nanoarchaeota archaeon]
MEESEKPIEERKEKIKRWLKSSDNLLIFGLIGFITLVYLYFFFKIGPQPIWFDEGDYLSIARVWGNNMAKPEWWPHFTLIRPLLMPLVWSIFLKFGFSEMFLRFATLLIPSLFASFVTFKLAESLFNKKVALIATIAFALNWVWMFYTFRILTDIPSALFGILSLYFFWEFYEKKQKNYGLYLSVAFGILAFLARYIGGIILASIAVYILITRRLKVIKQKELYFSVIVVLLCLSPFFIYNYSHFDKQVFPALSFYQGSESTAVQRPVYIKALTEHIPNLLGASFNNLGLLLIVFFIIGFILILEFVLYADKLFKGEINSKNNLIFIFVILVVPFLYLIFGIRTADTRYLLTNFSILCIVLAYGADFIISKLQNVLKIRNLSLIILIILSISMVYWQVSASNAFIKNKYGSYGEVKEAGIWLRDNTEIDAKIITASLTQNQYYSERQSYDFYNSQNKLTNDAGCYSTSLYELNESCKNITEIAFNEKIAQLKPDYLVISVFEPAYTPIWAYTYPQRYNMTFMKAFGNNNGQPLAIIFKF